MTFNVTQKHIDEGDDSYGGCPVALAIMEGLRMVEGVDCVLVNYTIVVIHRVTDRTSYPLPKFVTSWITVRDAHFPGTSPNPFSFELEIA